MAKKKTDPFTELKTSAEKVWLAGLGALAEAEKRGDKLFKSLVKKGKKYEDVLPDASDALKDSVSSAKSQANVAWRDLETLFDRQVHRAMKRMGVASQDEVNALKKEIAKLKKAGASSASKKSGKKTPTRKKAAKKKTATVTVPTPPASTSPGGESPA